MTQSRLKSLSPVLLLATMLSGCGPKEHLFPVQGVVVLSDGRPLAYAAISMESTDLAHVGRAISDEQGRFRMRLRGKDDGLPKATYRGLILPPTAPDPDQATPLPFKAEYTRYTTSGLEFTVDGPLEDVRIEVK